MNSLLVSLLKIDPLERMTFPEFFDFIDDLMKSKVEVINLLHGYSFKFMMETGMRLDTHTTFNTSVTFFPLSFSLSL